MESLWWRSSIDAVFSTYGTIQNSGHIEEGWAGEKGTTVYKNLITWRAHIRHDEVFHYEWS